MNRGKHKKNISKFYFLHYSSVWAVAGDDDDGAENKFFFSWTKYAQLGNWQPIPIPIPNANNASV